MRALALLLLVTACAPEHEADDTGEDDVTQTIPVGVVNFVPWFEMGYELKWQCQANVEPPQPTSPHGIHRVCINARGVTMPTDLYPVNAGFMQLLYDDAGQNVVGASALRRVNDSDSTDGDVTDAWWWYEFVPTTNTTEVHDANGLVVDAYFGTAVDTCAACHGLAGTPGHPGIDFILSLTN